MVTKSEYVKSFLLVIKDFCYIISIKVNTNNRLNYLYVSGNSRDYIAVFSGKINSSTIIYTI